MCKFFSKPVRDVIDSTKNIREIVTSYGPDNKIVYTVNFIKEEHHTIYHGKHKVREHVNTHSDDGIIQFATIEGAEAYAKNFCKCEVEAKSYGRYFVYPNGYENVDEYGYFELDTHMEGPLIQNFKIFEKDWDHYSFNFYKDLVTFSFYRKYEKKYGRSYSIDKFDLFAGKDVISGLLDHINEGGKVVKRFDVNTLEALPVNKLKATSEELKRLEELITDYNNTTEKYIKLLDTINKR